MAWPLLLAFLFKSAYCLPALEFDRAKRAAPVFTTSSSVVAGAINVHLQPHTHNDLGWLKTFDEYLVGANNTIQAAGVKYVYDSVVTALLRNPDRRFISVEMGFLMRWLDLQPPPLVAQVKQLVAEDRLQLCNAGWTMHDEAVAGYADALDQMSLGARLANASFGPAAAARVAWSIDVRDFARAGGRGGAAQPSRGALSSPSLQAPPYTTPRSPLATAPRRACSPRKWGRAPFSTGAWTGRKRRGRSPTMPRNTCGGPPPPWAPPRRCSRDQMSTDTTPQWTPGAASRCSSGT
jgi:hypothetical protein